MNNQEEYREYDTVMIPLLSGEEKEFAIVDEFDLDEKHYIVVSLVENDMILDGCYVYRAAEENGEMMIERIEDEAEMMKAAEFFEQKHQDE